MILRDASPFSQLVALINRADFARSVKETAAEKGVSGQLTYLYKNWTLLQIDVCKKRYYPKSHGPRDGRKHTFYTEPAPSEATRGVLVPLKTE